MILFKVDLPICQWVYIAILHGELIVNLNGHLMVKLQYRRIIALEGNSLLNTRVCDLDVMFRKQMDSLSYTCKALDFFCHIQS